MKKLLISLITFNTSDKTLACLKSLNTLVAENLLVEVVIIDNASKEPFVFDKRIISQFNTKVLRNEVNVGFSAGHNRAIHYALEQNIDYIIILNNDTEVDKNLIVSLVNAAQKEIGVGLISPKIYFAKGHEFHKERYKTSDLGKVLWYAGGTIDWSTITGKHRGVDEVDTGQYDHAEKTGFATGCCMLVTADVFKKVGLLDEKYFLYYEDADFSERVKKTGYSIYYCPQAIVWHKNASSTGGSGSDLQDYFISRNRMLFGMHYAPFRSKFALFRESFYLLRKGRMWQKKGIIDYYLRRFGKGVYSI
jgi:GT2 family glycosyltransferase